ncbi:hypothetical protein BC826DRAFT_976745, partial [Russula brevipes]
MAKFGLSPYISTGETQKPRRSKAANQSIGSHLSGIPEMPCRSTEAIAQRKQTQSQLRFDEEKDMRSTSKDWSSEESIEKLDGRCCKVHPPGNQLKSHKMPQNRMLPQRLEQQLAQAAMELRGQTHHSRTSQVLHPDDYESESKMSLFLTLREQGHQRILLGQGRTLTRIGIAGITQQIASGPPGVCVYYGTNPGHPGFESTGLQPRDIPGLASTREQTRDIPGFESTASFKIYVLSESENELSQTVDKWVQGLVCSRGNGPDGLLARVDIAWSVVAQSHPRTPHSLCLLAVEVSHLSRHVSLWQSSYIPLLALTRELSSKLTRVPSATDNSFTNESWYWSQLGLGNGHDADSRSRSVSGPMQDPGPIHSTAVARTADDRHAVDSQSPDESDQGEDENELESGREILSQTPAQVGKRAKGKAGKKQKRSRWAIPNKANIDFRIDIHELIRKLRPGQLLTTDEVYSAPEWHGFERIIPSESLHASNVKPIRGRAPHEPA